MSPWDGKMDGSCTVWLGVKRQSDGRSDGAVGRPLAPNAQEADGGTLHGGRTARGGSRDVDFYFIFILFLISPGRPPGVYLLTVQ